MENDQVSHQLPQSAVMITDNDGQLIEESPPPFLYTSAAQTGTENSDSANSTFDSAIIDSMQLLITEMQRLKEDFETKVKYDESKDRLIDSLHRELQVYREGLHFKILRPVFIDLIAMHDDLGKLIESMMTEEASKMLDRTIKNLQSFQESIEEILRRNGVEAFSVEDNTFISSKQRALQAIGTSDAVLNKQIARRVRKGFEYEGKVLRPELVVTYRAVPGN